MDRATDRHDVASTRWLARWGVLVVMAVGGLVVCFFGSYAAVSTRPGLGADLDELIMAAYAPLTYRLAMVFDALGWLAMGGLLVLAGLALRTSSTVLGGAGMALGATAVIGIAGGFLRMAGVGDLGRAYGQAGADQAAIEASYRTLQSVIGALFDAGDLTMGVGFLAIGWAALAAPWFPRTAAWLLLLPGFTSLALLAGEVVLGVFLFPVVFVHVGLLAAASVLLARRWWNGEPVAAALAAAT